MTAIDFDQLFEGMSDGVKTIAEDSLKDYESEAKADGQQAINNLKDDLQQWVKELETGSLSREDLRYLLEEEEDLTKMVALKQAGLAEVRVDEFRNDIINMILGKITGLIKV